MMMKTMGMRSATAAAAWSHAPGGFSTISVRRSFSHAPIHLVRPSWFHRASPPLPVVGCSFSRVSLGSVSRSSSGLCPLRGGASGCSLDVLTIPTRFGRGSVRSLSSSFRTNYAADGGGGGDDKGFWETFKERVREGFNTKEGKELQEELERTKKGLEDIAQSDMVKKAQRASEAAREDLSSKASSLAEEAKTRGSQRAEELTRRIDQIADDIEGSEVYQRARSRASDVRQGVDRGVDAISSKIDSAADAVGSRTSSILRRVESTDVYQSASKMYADSYDRVQKTAPFLLPPSRDDAPGDDASSSNSSSLVVTNNQPSVWDSVVSRMAASSVGKRVADIRAAIEHSDNPLVQRSVDAGYRLRRLGAQMLRPSEYGKAIAAVSKRSGGFDQISFVNSLEERVLPDLMKAIHAQDKSHLKQWVRQESPMENILNHQFDTLSQRNLSNESELLFLSDVELHTGELSEDGDPTFLVSWRAQVKLCLRDATGKVVEGAEDNVTMLSYVATIVNADEEDWKFVMLEEIESHEGF